MTGKTFLTTEELVQWTYFTQRADVMPSSHGPSMGASMFDRVDSMSETGWLIGGSSSSSGKIHDDAFLVHDIVSAMDGPTRRALMLHGFMRTRPDARIGARERLAPKSWGSGENPARPGEWLRWPETANEIKRGGNGGWFTPLMIVDAKHEVRRDRAEWEAWAHGLAGVYSWVVGRLTAHVLKPELPVLRPWEPRKSASVDNLNLG